MQTPVVEAPSHLDQFDQTSGQLCRHRPPDGWMAERIATADLTRRRFAWDNVCYVLRCNTYSPLSRSLPLYGDRGPGRGRAGGAAPKDRPRQISFSMKRTATPKGRRLRRNGYRSMTTSTCWPWQRLSRRGLRREAIGLMNCWTAGVDTGGGVGVGEGRQAVSAGTKQPRRPGRSLPPSVIRQGAPAHVGAFLCTRVDL